MKWFRREWDRCLDGMIRPEDGEWIPGPLYWYMNYCPMTLTKLRKGKSRKADRVTDHPETWDGVYLRFHYMDQAMNGGLYNDWLGGNHGAELASRGKSKSYSMAAVLAHNFVIGDNREA
jgi:hypothetical protein